MSNASFSLKISNSLVMEMVNIPAGKFIMGSDKRIDKDAGNSETPQHSIDLEEYGIGKYPVTIAQYRRFVSDTGYRPPSGLGDTFFSKDIENCPVTGINWHDARAFCYWLHWLTKEFVCVPTEAEWEKAARGTDGRIRPWGNQPIDSNLLKPKAFHSNTPVGLSSPITDSPYGCVDMVTNVYELCNTIRHKGPLNFYQYPYNSNDGREENREASQRAMRGGALYTGDKVDMKEVRSARRQWTSPNSNEIFQGFRIIVTKSESRWKMAFPSEAEKQQLETGLNLSKLNLNNKKEFDVVGYDIIGIMLNFSDVKIRCLTATQLENILTRITTLAPNVKSSHQWLSDNLPGTNMVRLTNLGGRNQSITEMVIQELFQEGWQIFKPEIDRTVSPEEWIGLKSPQTPENDWVWLRHALYSEKDTNSLSPENMISTSIPPKIEQQQVKPNETFSQKPPNISKEKVAPLPQKNPKPSSNSAVWVFIGVGLLITVGAFTCCFLTYYLWIK